MSYTPFLRDNPMNTTPASEFPARAVAAYPTLEAAVAALGQKVFGAEIRIEPVRDEAFASEYPPLEPGWLLFGEGPLRRKPMTSQKDDVARLDNGEWDYSGWGGYLRGRIYAIRAGSELARLNGLEPVKAPPLVPAMGPQYRVLSVGEVISPGDECCSEGKWIPTPAGCHGVTVMDCGTRQEVFRNVGYYRRPIATSNVETLTAERDAWAETAAHHISEAKSLREELAAWEGACRRKDKDKDIDTLLTRAGELEKEAERLHAEWHAAATEVTDLRDEVKRLTTARDTFRDTWEAAAENIMKLTAERSALHARVAELEKPVPEPQYRELEDGELILATDEWFDSDRGVWKARISVKPGDRLHLIPNGGKNTPHRRRIN